MDLYAVWYFFEDGSHHRELERVSAERAVKCAIGAAQSVGARMGILTEIRIVDQGDQLNWHWIKGQGIMFPPEFAGRLK